MNTEGYLFLYAYNLDSLNRELEQYINEGWSPYGFLIISEWDAKKIYIQAIIKIA